MTHTYNISGITCDNCVAKVKSELLKIGDITEANVQQEAPQATISMQQHVPLQALQAAISKAGNYTITETAHSMHTAAPEEDSRSWFETYKPILLIFLYISLVTIIAARSAGGFDEMKAMRIFMSGFFLAFSFFKLLDIKGFAESYSTYDVLAKKSMAWGYIYPFLELALGIGYAVNFNPVLLNAGTFIVMTISIIGVLQSVFNKRKIRCACLGAVFNLPMSTVTIIEDALMIAMSGIMLLALL
jgi:copper chaperone CopZ